MYKCCYVQSKTQLIRRWIKFITNTTCFGPCPGPSSGLDCTGELYRVTLYISVTSNEISWIRFLQQFFAVCSFRVVYQWVKRVWCGVRRNCGAVGMGGGVIQGFELFLYRMWVLALCRHTHTIQEQFETLNHPSPHSHSPT